jgi:hypothetical protein
MTERHTVNDFLEASRSRIERLDQRAALVEAAAGARDRHALCRATAGHRHHPRVGARARSLWLEAVDRSEDCGLAALVLADEADDPRG